MLQIDPRKLKRKLTLSTNYFLSLARSIIYQQISTSAGNAIYKKFLALFGSSAPAPRALMSFSAAQLKQAGLSPQKRSYLKDLAEKFLDGTVNPKLFPTMTDTEITDHLTRVKGIGPWTADMFLIFALNRPNILPVGDLGIKKGFQKVFKLRKLPSEKKMRKLAKPHAGKHSYLSLYLWQAMDD